MSAPMKKPAAAKEPVPNPDVMTGDEVYFRHAKGPHAARVLATGKHGITVHHEGKPHPVRWEHVLGHKTRKAQKYDVLDEGEDGLIVKDAAGQRKYITVPPEARGEQMVLAKAMGAGAPRLVTFAKAGKIANRPGLSLQPQTDKNGVQTKHWVRTNKELPKGDGGAAPEAGKKPPSHVAFENGHHKGHGKVISSGAAGHTVEDAAGGRHRIPHAAVTHEWHGDDTPEKSPHDGAAPSNNNNRSAEEIAHALFDTSELEKLPSRAPQPVDSWEQLHEKGVEGLKQFKGMLGEVAKALDLETGRKPKLLDAAQKKENEEAAAGKREPEQLDPQKYMLPEHWDSDRGFLFMGKLKGEERAKQKVAGDYGGDWSQVRDMVRATIAVPSVVQLPKVLDELKKAGIELAQKPKNNLIKPLPGGYRDLNLIVKLPNGLLAELQVHVKPMTVAKGEGHKHYEVTRSIEAKYKKHGTSDDPAKWDPEDREKHAAAMKEQEKLYGAAWEKATKEEKPSSNLTKSVNASRIVLLKSFGEQHG